jgi:hypothetical protein
MGESPTPQRPQARSLLTAFRGSAKGGFARFKIDEDGGRRRVAWLTMGLTAVAWLPVMILAIVDGVAWGNRVDVPFVRDFLPYGQLVVSIPVLMLGEIAARRRLGLAAGELGRSGIVDPADRGRLHATLHRVADLGRGRAVNAGILALTLIATGVSLFEARDWLTGGWQVSSEGLTLPGWWYLLVSLPVMRFLALRWLWRGLVWAWALLRVAGLDLRPKPMHPDRAGGLAFLGEAQVAFGALVFTFGVQLSCLAADAHVYRGVDLMTYRGEFVAFVLTSVATLLLPLLAFGPKLVLAREEQLVVLSGFGDRGAAYLGRRFESGDWDDESGLAEISSLADFGALYENARLMKPLPMDRRDLVMLILVAVVPFVPLVFLVVPAREVLRTLAALLV